MTAMSGLATGFMMLVLFRIGVGIGEAGVNPASQSIVADYFPPHRRSFAMSILALGANIGMILGFMLGGYVSQTYGWRAALFVVGAPGLLLAFVMFFLFREPPRAVSKMTGWRRRRPCRFRPNSCGIIRRYGI